MEWEKKIIQKKAEREEVRQVNEFKYIINYNYVLGRLFFFSFNWIQCHLKKYKPEPKQKYWK